MDKQELQNRVLNPGINNNITINGKNYTREDKVLSLIDQLDEPEITTEQAWEKIAEKFEEGPKELCATLVSALPPYNLSEKPEIPKFVADWIRGFRILDVTDLDIIGLYFSKEIEKKCEQWITDNFNDFIKALVNGYTEKAPVWVVRINEKLYFCRFTDKYFEENPDEPTYSESGNPEFIKKFTNKDKAEAVATLINGEVEEWSE